MNFTPRYPGHIPPAAQTDLDRLFPIRFDGDPTVRTFASTPLAPPPTDPEPKKPRASQVEYPTRRSRQGPAGGCGPNRAAKKRKEKVAKAATMGPRALTLCGSRSTYRRGCRCEVCAKTESDWRREYYRSRHPKKPKRAPVNPDDCQHQRWYRQRIGDGVMARIQCRVCGISRMCPSEQAADLSSGRIVSPEEIPPPVGRGKRPRPANHGSHAQYRKGCRCDVCIGFRLASRRKRYADLAGGEVRPYRKAA